MPVTRKQSIQLRERDDHCWHCGQVEGLVVHHRKNRGMGGRGKSLDIYENLMRICPSYNMLMESDSATAKQAREWGHKLGNWDDFSVACFDVTENVWYLLDTKGTKHEHERPSTLF